MVCKILKAIPKKTHHLFTPPCVRFVHSKTEAIKIEEMEEETNSIAAEKQIYCEHYQTTESDDSRQAASKAEKEAWDNLTNQMTLYQRFTAWRIMRALDIRHSFIHGNVRRGLTAMAVYAAGSEFFHDFLHDMEIIHTDSALFTFFGTSHAVGFIVLSHLSEHYKEYLLDKDKPKHHVAERKRLDAIRIFSHEKQVTWPVHIQKYHKQWQKIGGNLGCISKGIIQDFNKENKAS